MHATKVTFIVATYKRVRALTCTLRSLSLQTERAWDAIVVGDACYRETGDAIRALQEPRIRYYNLPARCGEQSGPNNAGLHLASGAYVAFLNHDDLLLPDHVDTALGALEPAGDFYVGRFADATRLDTDEAGRQGPVFTRIRPTHSDLRLLLGPDQYLFEPGSFWIVRTPYARAVGRWRPARRLWRTPLRDWLMRAWRLRGRFRFGSRITGLRFWTQNVRSGAPFYAQETPEHEYMLERLQHESADATREFLRDRFGLWADAPPGDAEQIYGRRLGRIDAARWAAAEALYTHAGVDLLALQARVRGAGRGAEMQALSVKRTGAPLPPESTIDRFLADPETYRVL